MPDDARRISSNREDIGDQIETRRSSDEPVKQRRGKSRPDMEVQIPRHMRDELLVAACSQQTCQRDRGSIGGGKQGSDSRAGNLQPLGRPALIQQIAGLVVRGILPCCVFSMSCRRHSAWSRCGLIIRGVALEFSFSERRHDRLRWSTELIADCYDCSGANPFGVNLDDNSFGIPIEFSCAHGPIRYVVAVAPDAPSQVEMMLRKS